MLKIERERERERKYCVGGVRNLNKTIFERWKIIKMFQKIVLSLAFIENPPLQLATNLKLAFLASKSES